jgi:RNA polymerase sigma-70 factor (ECF subfamily)
VNHPAGRHDELSDEALFTGYLAGDDAMLATLLHRYERPLHGYLYHCTGDAALAAELFQDTFLRACRRGRTYQPGRPFKPWLYQIARNLARDHYRRRRPPTVNLDDLAVPPADPHGSPAATAAAGDTARLVAAAVAELPAAQREAFLLRAGEGLAYDAIAALTGRPLNTIKSDLHRALQQVRRWLFDRAGGTP